MKALAVCERALFALWVVVVYGVGVVAAWAAVWGYLALLDWALRLESS